MVFCTDRPITWVLHQHPLAILDALPLLTPLPTGPSMCCFPPCVYVFSSFCSHLQVRTCSVWFSVLVSVCWEWWFPASSMSLQRHELVIFYDCVVFHGVYVPHFLYPVYHWWAFGLVLRFHYCKQCHNEHTSAHVFIIEQFLILWVYTQKWDCWVK